VSLGVKAETLKGHLDALVLAVLAHEPLHGYAVIEALATRSEGAFELAEGTLYPVLHRLEADGLLASAWSEAAGRRRRVYRLTRRGRRALAQRREEWSSFVRAVDAVLA
jgi:PadR family transcriptional regulator, regulatory protein PadR